MRKCIFDLPRVPHGELSPHQLFASFSITAGPICPKLSHYTLCICLQMVFEFDEVLMGTAEVGFGVPHGEVWGVGELSPHALFALFSITTGPIALKLSHYTPCICPQMVFEFDRVPVAIAKVGFGVPQSSPWGTFSPCAFRVVLHNHWADRPQTCTVCAQHMPAGCISFLRCSDAKCKS